MVFNLKARPLTLLARFPFGFWFLSATGEIVDGCNTWTDGQGHYWLGDRHGPPITRVEPWELWPPVTPLDPSDIPGGARWEG